MPELPEVEIVVRALNKALTNLKIDKVKSIGKVRIPINEEELEELLKGKKILGVRRRAKYIIIELEENTAILAHLGMTGSFHIKNNTDPLNKHDRIIFTLDNKQELRFLDIRRFGFVIGCQLPYKGAEPEQLANIGPEPLTDEFTADILYEYTRNKNLPIKPLLMEQKTVAGVGNIYASEALFLAGVDPSRKSHTTTLEECKKIVKEIKKILKKSIELGGSSIRNYQQVDGKRGSFQLGLNVYGKENMPCPKCKDKIKSIKQAGRSTFYCEKCQK